MFMIMLLLAFIQRLLERALPSWADQGPDLSGFGCADLELEKMDAGDLQCAG